MESKMGEARISIVESLRMIQEVFRRKPDPFMYLIQVVMESKSDEVINIFSQAFPEEKSRMVDILIEIDPANKSKYERINSLKYSIITCYALKTVCSKLCSDK